MARAEEPAFTVRSLRSDDYAPCEELQRHVWGDDFRELVPSSMMMISQKLGGVLAGAFDPGGELVAFVYGLTGPCAGRMLHWSHMLGVHRDFRGHGLGRRLKLLQRRLLLDREVDVVEWTYDPLESRNAHLNLNRLGAEPVGYLRDLYGDGSTSLLHAGIGTDRFVVRWRLADPDVETRIAGPGAPAPGAARDAPVVNADADGPFDPRFELPDADVLRVAIPADVQAVKSESPDTARRWRESTRLALETCLERGYRIPHLIHDRPTGRSYYVAIRK